MKKKIIKWLIVLLLAIAGGIVAMNYGMQVLYTIFAKIIAIALVLTVIFVAMVIFLETYLAKHRNLFKHEIEKRKAKQEFEEMNKRFSKENLD